MTDQERKVADAVRTIKEYCEETDCADCFIKEVCDDCWDGYDSFGNHPAAWPDILDPDDRPDEPTVCGIPLSVLGFHDDD